MPASPFTALIVYNVALATGITCGDSHATCDCTSPELTPRVVTSVSAAPRAHLGAQIALGSHLVGAIPLWAPADLAHQAELNRVDGAEQQLLLEEASWVGDCA